MKTYDVIMTPSNDGNWVLKSEADKVIAEKDAEIVELKKQVHDYALGMYVMQARAKKEARHDKYKRCLAMAEMCKERHDIEDMRVNSHCASWDYTESEEMKYWERWKKRWQGLAEKLKEAK